MEFVNKLAARSAEQFKETSDELWGLLGGSTSSSKTMRDAGKTAGKYATMATIMMIMNYPHKAELFRDSFNANGPGPTGVKGLGESKEEAANMIARMLYNATAISQSLALEAVKMQGYADPSRTSTIEDIRKLMPILTANLAPKGKEKKGKSKTNELSHLQKQGKK